MELKEKEIEIEKELHYYEVWSGSISLNCNNENKILIVL